jgi:hypothetical protein
MAMAESPKPAVERANAAEHSERTRQVTQVSSQQQRSSSWPVWVILIALVGAMVVVAAEGPLTGPKVAHIAGRLTLEGIPMREGHSVVFMEPSRGDLAFGITDADGQFVVNSWKNGEMVPGRYKAYVVPPSVRPEGLRQFPGSEDILVKLPAEYPDRYLDVKTTPLVYDVVVGENRFEIDLEQKTMKSDSDGTPAGAPHDPSS